MGHWVSQLTVVTGAYLQKPGYIMDHTVQPPKKQLVDSIAHRTNDFKLEKTGFSGMLRDKVWLKLLHFRVNQFCPEFEHIKPTHWIKARLLSISFIHIIGLVVCRYMRHRVITVDIKKNRIGGSQLWLTSWKLRYNILLGGWTLPFWKICVRQLEFWNSENPTIWTVIMIVLLKPPLVMDFHRFVE